MILELYIKNIAIIGELRVRFGDGFNVLSGETGAGKSIIVDSMNLILGSRGDSELIKFGEQSDAGIRHRAGRGADYLQRAERFRKKYLPDWRQAGQSFGFERNCLTSGQYLWAKPTAAATG